MNNSEIDNLISLLSRLPGIGPRSARRMALNLLKQPESLMKPLADSLILTAETVRNCNICGNLDTEENCSICVDERRDILMEHLRYLSVDYLLNLIKTKVNKFQCKKHESV